MKPLSDALFSRRTDAAGLVAVERQVVVTGEPARAPSDLTDT
jgi:hypothetical protein